jgi:hypothetical protein
MLFVFHEQFSEDTYYDVFEQKDKLPFKLIEERLMNQLQEIEVSASKIKVTGELYPENILKLTGR